MKAMKHFFTVLILLCSTSVVKAYNFEANGIYYNILSEDEKTVEVMCGTYYYDNIIIPEKVSYSGKMYNVVGIGDNAFSGHTWLTSITIPNSVTSIRDNAFISCAGLTSITIPNSVTSIGDYAFTSCTGLTSVVIGNSVISIGDDAFSNCTELTSITIPNSVTSIGDYAFNYCFGLMTVYNFSNLTFSKGSKKYGSVAYYADKVYNAPNGFIDGDFIWYENKDGMTLGCYLGNATELAMPTDYNGKSVTSIGDYAFSGCTGLTSVVIGNSVISIGERAFYGCTGLTSITIPNSVTSIESSAFNGCTGLTSVVIGNSVISIGDDAFRGCTGLTSITIPNSVTSIGERAFYGCTGLTSITIPNSVTSIGERAFYGCAGLKTVYNFSNLTFRKGSTGYGYVAYYADKVYNAPNGFIDGDFIWYENEDGMTLDGYLGNATELAMPTDYNGKSVTSIGDYAFSGCTGLTSITIPNSVTSIESSAFYGCNNIEKLYIGSSVESIGDKAFAGCEKITEIKVALEKPIKGSDDIFANAVYDNATLYIPNGTEQLYQKREPWNMFFDIVEIDFTEIEDVEAEGERVQTIYDLQGRKVEVPSEGLYIINGKKVMIK